jgi:predicted AlkP superfamily pyrophosphatase or phosphodiesterase
MALAILGLVTPSWAQQVDPEPRLLVMISVDQLRADLLDRFAPAFAGGFKRMAEHGYRFTGASHAHAITHTAAGHATLSTGVFPSRSGIVANDWQQRSGEVWFPMYSVQDAESPIVGFEGMEGRSPRNLLREGLADWVLAANPDARVVSLSGKDRAAITMAGKSKSHVYWLAETAPSFVTSTYYRDEMPGWVKDFNETVLQEVLADTIWEQKVPPEFRSLARADSAAYEQDGIHTTFPHMSTSADSLLRSLWPLTQPNTDRAVSLMAREAIDALDLGQREPVDYLALSFSATDHVGHAYGPFSQEQLDNLVRLDQELADLFDYLDERVGEGRWVAGFSADHGVMTMPEYTASEGGEAVRVSGRERRVALGQALQDAFQSEGTPDQIAERMARVAEEERLVTKAYTHFDLTTGQPADSFAVLFRNSYYPGRAAGLLSRFGVETRYAEHELVYGTRGTTHGTPYWHDRHVPLMFLGAGVEAGVSDARVYTVDIAPTLAAFAGIPAPYDLDGRVIYR